MAKSLKDVIGTGASSTPFAPIAQGDYELYAREAEAREARPYTAQYGPNAGEEQSGHPSVNVQFEVVGEEGGPGVGRVLFHNFRVNLEDEAALGFAKGAYKRLTGQDMDEALSQLDESLEGTALEDAFAAVMAAAIVGGRIVANVRVRKQMRNREWTGDMENYISRWKD